MEGMCIDVKPKITKEFGFCDHCDSQFVDCDQFGDYW